MYDQTTAGLIRSTPPLDGLDRQSLPDYFSRCYAAIVAHRVRLRAEEEPPEELSQARAFAQKLARTNEALVSLSPSRSDRRSAAFVAATAYQLVHQIDHLSGSGNSRASLTETGITADVSSMLLFLVAEASADATEVAQRLRLPDAGLERELARTLVELASGQLETTMERPLLSADEAVRTAPHLAAADALYYLTLQAVRLLASDLSGKPLGTTAPTAMLGHVKILAAPTERPLSPFGSQGHTPTLGPVALLPGPFHLASLLLATAETLTATSVIKVPPPEGLEPARWATFLGNIAERRPYIWPNLRDAIENGYLQAGTSSVVAFPTGAGKSAVSQLKIGAQLLAGKRTIFLAPTHALVDQTVRASRAAFPGWTIRTVRADEFPVATQDADAADILVLTPEACLLLLHTRPSDFDGVGLLVFDECHLIHARTVTDNRAADAMLCILNFVRVVPDADLLLLSAMIKNAPELATWLGELTRRPTLDFSMAWKPTRQLRGCLVYDEQRVTELQSLLDRERGPATTKSVPRRLKRRLTAQPHGFFSVRQTWASENREHYTLLSMGSEEPEFGTNEHWKLTPNAGAATEVLAVPAARAGIRTLVFSQSIPFAASIAERVSKQLGPCEITLTPEETRWLAVAVDELGGADKLYVDVHEQTVISRSATHHGQLLPEERRLIESLYARPDGLSVLAATATLGQGMNLPSEFVIIAQDSRFDQETDKLRMLEAWELLNAAGRAGRAGHNATGIVIVIPGQVVGLEDKEGRRDSRWRSLQKVFGQTDQCLAIDDPLTAVLDRIHNEGEDSDQFDRYVVSRLCGSGAKEGTESRLRQTLQSTFAAFRKRRQTNDSWIESRTEAAVALLPHLDPDDGSAATLQELSSNLGLPEEALSALRMDLLESSPPAAAPVGAWCDWMIKWLSVHPEEALQLLRPSDLEELFGSRFRKLDSDEARVALALPKLGSALHLWMNGETLSAVQPALTDSPHGRKKAASARKFVANLLPTLAYLFAAASTIVAREPRDGLTLPDAASRLSYVDQCVRLGFSSLEMYALYEEMRPVAPSRREVHREFGKLQTHLPTPVGIETWPELRARVAFARQSASEG